jgi:outer membrane lipoprotein carrier protein
MFSLLLFGVSLSSATAADVDDVVKKIELHYKDVNSLEADFLQVTNNPALQNEIRQQGHLSMMKPHNLRWDFEGERSYIHDGETIWLWDPNLNQVVITKSKGKKDQITSLLTDLSSLKKEYTITLKEEVDSAYVLVIQPKKEGQAFDELALKIHKEKFMLEKITYSGESTGSVEISFTDVKFNTVMKLDLFQFTPPDDAEVIEINE